MERTTYSGYEHAKAFYEDFGLQNIGQSHDLYVQSDILLLAGIFESLELLTDLLLLADADMLLMVEKVINGGICHAGYKPII